MNAITDRNYNSAKFCKENIYATTSNDIGIVLSPAVLDARNCCA